MFFLSVASFSGVVSPGFLLFRSNQEPPRVIVYRPTKSKSIEKRWRDMVCV